MEKKPVFSLKKYFTANFDLGNKPKVEKVNFTFKSILISAVALIAGFVIYPLIGLIALVIVGIFWGTKFAKKAKQQKAANDWQEMYNYCYNNWDAEYDKFLSKYETELNAKNRGMKKLGIDESQLAKAGVKPFDIYGNRYEGFYRKGKDGVYRTQYVEITWLFFSVEQMYIYAIKTNLLDKSNTELTQEFFYEDIVSVSTATESTSLPAKNSANGSTKDEQIETEQFKVMVPGDKLSFAFTPNQTAINSVNGMKGLIREKKKDRK